MNQAFSPSKTWSVSSPSFGGLDAEPVGALPVELQGLALAACLLGGLEVQRAHGADPLPAAESGEVALQDLVRGEDRSLPLPLPFRNRGRLLRRRLGGLRQRAGGSEQAGKDRDRGGELHGAFSSGRVVIRRAILADQGRKTSGARIA